MSELVSVVIPVYNSEKYLEDCLNSILDQTYENIEIIVIDDGSTDSSANILKKYSDQVTILSQKNSGLASALHLGISKMKGHWFKWFSPDDIMHPHTVETLVDEIKKFPDNTIIYSNWNIIDDSGTFLRKFYESDYNQLSKFNYNIRLLDSQQINVNTTLIPYSILKQGCTFRTLNDPVAIDYDFFLRAALFYDIKFHLINDHLINYRIHTSQLSHSNINSTLSYLDTLKDELLSQLDNENKQKYTQALIDYKKSKPLLEKSKALGLKFTTNMPSWISDKIFTIYLNKIRHNR